MAEINNSIADYIDSLNNSIESIQANKITFDSVKPEDLPSDFKLMMGPNAEDNKLLKFVFDTKLDRTIDNLLNKFLSGDFDAINQYSDLIKKVFESVGIGEDAFTGPVSQTLLDTLANSINSINFNTTKSKIRKCMIITKNLKTRAKSIDNAVMRKKYLEAVYALKQTLKFISKVYKNRRILTNRVRNGLKIAIHEDFEFVDEEFDFKWE